MKRTFHYLLLFSFFILLFSVTATTSTDFSQDLGRHLKLGEIIVETGRVPSTNLFSYTNPQFKFINHHWLSEVIFFILYEKISPNTLLILKLVFVFSAFFFVLKIAKEKSDIVSAVLSAVIFLPLFLDRNNIRPELFGFTFYAVCLYLFISIKRLQGNLLILPFVLLLWVNLHISFIFGMMVSLLIIIKIALGKIKNKQSLTILLLYGLSFSVVLINPNGLIGALYPFTIFGNYGYPIAENQSVFFLSAVVSDYFVPYFFMVSPLIIATLIFVFYKKNILEGILLTCMFVLSILQVRHFPFLVLTVIPFTALMIHSLFLYIKNLLFKNKLDYYHNVVVLLLCFFIFFSSFYFFDNSFYKTFDSDKRFGFGYDESEKEATDFILDHHIQGNIFNNFDIGGYLIYRLYPNHLLFTDNRPEAYPRDFVQKISIPAQENVDFQNKIFKEYQINTIVFSHTDQTPWAQQFLSRIQQEKKWKLVFANSKIVIFTQTTDLFDLRSNNLFFKAMIEKENKYLDLLRITGLMQIINKEDLASVAFEKAKSFGPDSCFLKRLTVEQMSKSVHFSQVDDYKRSSF